MGANSTAVLILLRSFLLMVFPRFPIVYAVTLSSVFYLLYQGYSLTAICQQMVKGISSSSLMAVPSFITMDYLMRPGGISEKLTVLANTCVGWTHGGITMVNIVISYFFGGISGSAAADMASLGSILIPMMTDQGYDDDFSVAVTTASSHEGFLVPPSHNTVVYATTAGDISVGNPFPVGYIPRALLTVSPVIGSYIISVKCNYPKGEKFRIISLTKQLSAPFWALATVLTVVFSVMGGVSTATESAAVAIIYSLIVSIFVYRGLDWKGVWRVFGGCVDTLSIVIILVVTSNVFGFCLTQLHVPVLAASAITGVANSPIVLALLLDLVLLVLGYIMDTASIILVTTPIPLSIVTPIDLDPIQLGIVVVLNRGIGLLTPPIGAVLFIGPTVTKIPMERVVRATLPFCLYIIITLSLITFVPTVGMWPPNVLGGLTK